MRPACFWYCDEDMSGIKAQLLKCAYAPVALFDKAYDDLGIDPYVTGTTPGGTLPSISAGSWPNRTLILYNDEFHTTQVEVEVIIRVDGQQFAQGTRTYDVTLGEHVDIPCKFQAPMRGGKVMDMVLITRKNGVQKFEEARRFRISGSSSGSSSSSVTLSAAEDPDY